MDSARSDLIPLRAQRVASAAREVLVCFPGHLPDGLAEDLRALAPPAVRLEFQCPPSTAVEVILALLNKGHLVLEGEALSEGQVFFDRRYGYRLPGWFPLSDSFTMACRFAWNRTAAFVRVGGTVVEIIAKPESDFTLVRLAENPHLRLSMLKRLGIPVLGEMVLLLG